MFNDDLLWSSQVNNVKIKRRPTKLWCFIQPGLMPIRHIFANLTWIYSIIHKIYTNSLWNSWHMRQFTLNGGINTSPNRSHATVLAILTKITVGNTTVQPLHFLFFIMPGIAQKWKHFVAIQIAGRRGSSAFTIYRQSQVKTPDIKTL